MIVADTPLVAVLFKGQRHKTTPKYCGGVLNPNKQFYVYRTEGNTNPMPMLLAMQSRLIAQQQAAQ